MNLMENIVPSCLGNTFDLERVFFVDLVIVVRPELRERGDERGEGEGEWERGRFVLRQRMEEVLVVVVVGDEALD
jgi:hypothetical protein